MSDRRVLPVLGLAAGLALAGFAAGRLVGPAPAPVPVRAAAPAQAAWQETSRSGPASSEASRSSR
jgi:hypothetical protein